MKQLIILLAFVAFGVTAQAQYESSVSQSSTSGGAWGSKVLPYYTSGDDTATNSDVIRMGIGMNLKYDVVLKTTVTKASGTIGTSWLIVRGSPDGTNWVTMNVGETKPEKDSISVTDAASGSYVFQFDKFPYKYIEVYYNQTGTTVTAPVTTLYYRKSED